MAEPYQLPVARLWSDEGSVAGAGFLAPRGVVVTCAHVVNAALGHQQLRREEPRGEIRIDLPWGAGKKEFRGSIVAWRPPVAPDMRRPDPCVDIAVLRLDDEPPAAATLQPQAPARVQEDTRFSVMGFPAGRDAGAGARGDRQGDGRRWLAPGRGRPRLWPDDRAGLLRRPGHRGRPTPARHDRPHQCRRAARRADPGRGADARLAAAGRALPWPAGLPRGGRRLFLRARRVAGSAVAQLRAQPGDLAHRPVRFRQVVAVERRFPATTASTGRLAAVAVSAGRPADAAARGDAGQSIEAPGGRAGTRRSVDRAEGQADLRPGPAARLCTNAPRCGWRSPVPNRRPVRGDLHAC